MKLSMVIRSNMFPTLSARIPQRTHEVVAASLERVRDGAAQRSRVDTGAMRDGWAVAFEGPTDGRVFNPVSHTVYSEYGTRYMPAQPMLTPSIDQERPTFIGNMAKLVSDLG